MKIPGEKRGHAGAATCVYAHKWFSLSSNCVDAPAFAMVDSYEGIRCKREDDGIDVINSEFGLG